MQLFHMYLCKLYSNTYRVQCRTDLDRKHGSHTDWMDRKAGPRPVVVALASFILVLNSVLVNASTYTATSDRKARSLVNRRVHRNRVLRQSYSNFPSTGISRSAREILQAGATAPRCVFDGGRCALNPGFPTNLGPPTTDTQKLIAYTYWLAGRQCDAATSRQSCEQLYDSGQGCVWNSEIEDCSLFWTPNKNWLSGNVLCPGSLAEAAAACTAAIYDRTSSYNTTAATAPPLRCASRPGCVWLPGSGSTPPPPPAADATNGTALRSESDPANGNGTASPSALTVSDLPIALLVPHLLAGFYDRPWADGVFAMEAPPVAAGVCVPQWVVEGQGSRSRALQARIDPKELRRLLAGLTTDSATLYLPVYDDLFGTCTGTQRAKQYLESADGGLCRSYDEPGTCVDNMACGWSDGIDERFPGAPSEGGCEAETGFMWELLYDQNDAWIKAINAAAQPCATAGTNPTACASAGGTIPVDYAVLDSYGTVRPSWMTANGGGTGGANGGGGLGEGPGGSLGRGGNGNSAHAAVPPGVVMAALAVLAGLLAAAVPGAV